MVKLQHSFSQKICKQEENGEKYLKCLKRKSTNYTQVNYTSKWGRNKDLGRQTWTEWIHYQQAWPARSFSKVLPSKENYKDQKPYSTQRKEGPWRKDNWK